MSSPITVYLITGAKRGLGLGLVTALLKRPNTTIIAGVRDTTASTSQALSSLPTADASKVIIVKIDSNDQYSAHLAVEGLKDISKIDTVIANAGITGALTPAVTQNLDGLRELFEVNAIAPLALFQAAYPLLQKAPKPMFIGITSAAAMISGMEQVPALFAGYAASKAALNSIVRRLHCDFPKLIAFVIHPGWVQTDMGNFGARTVAGLEEAPMTVETCINTMLEIADNATREKTSGTFQTADPAQPVAW